MKTELFSELSSLFDNELDADHRQAVLTAMRENAELRATWDDYQLIGDALRRSPDLAVDLTSRVMADLLHEPTILAPQARPARSISRYAAALAASLAGVGVVGWLALSSLAVDSQKVVFAVAQPVLPTKPTKPVNVVNTGRMQEYLVAHQAYSPSNHFDGGASYIRTVSASR